MPTPHIAADVGQIAPYVLMPGDPKRANRIAETVLENATLVSDVRGISIWTGEYQGHPMSAMGSGMGMASIGIYATELFRFYGVEAITRVGTAGVWRPDVQVRDVLIVSAAHTDSSLPTLKIPGVHLSLAPDFTLLRRAVEAAEASGAKYHVGPILTSDYFYVDRGELVMDLLTQYGTLGVEMEAASLYAVAAAEGGKALTVLTVSDHLVDSSQDLTAEERETCFAAMVRIAADAMIALP